jgi:hypothetical protein
MIAMQAARRMDPDRTNPSGNRRSMKVQSMKRLILRIFVAMTAALGLGQ